MSTPNPATTPWVPMWNLNGAIALTYFGAWVAGTYKDGDIVVYNGVAYMCVRPTSNPPAAWPRTPMPTQQLDRAINAANTAVTATTVAGANVVITGATLAYDGATTVEVSFATYAMAKGTTSIKVGVYDNGAQLGEIIHYLHTGIGPGFGRLQTTPAAGNHQFSIRAYVDAGQGFVYSGPGGSGQPVSAEMIVRRIV